MTSPPQEDRDMTGLLELAERCERATGENRMLEIQIAEAVGWEHLGETFSVPAWRAPGEVSFQRATENWPPRYTSAETLPAQSLVPEGNGWNVGGNTSIFYAMVANHPGKGSTPGLALSAAALRSRQSLVAGVV